MAKALPHPTPTREAREKQSDLVIYLNRKYLKNEEGLTGNNTIKEI
jgi:hypothetical protein